MKKFLKENWKFIIFVVIAGLIGGYFSALYLYDNLTEELLKQLADQNISKNMYSTVSTIQIVLLYGLLLSVVGIVLSKKVGLWKNFKIEKKALLITIIFGIIGGLVLYPGDSILFGSIDMVKKSYIEKPTLNFFIASLFYGGVIEEVMMRLFFMSLIVFVISKLFYRKEKEVPTKVFVISNIVAALLFAAGHLPTTIQTFGYVDSLILFRCFFMNGAFGIAFGWLYRKYGIQYSMLAHFGCHFVSKLIWLLFI